MEPLRILIVDDEIELVAALKERLELRGFDTEGVTTGTAALEFLEREPRDIVLLDLKMPGLGGLEVIQLIKRHWMDIEVILLTGHGSLKNVEEGMELGAFDYLMKPVRIEELVKALHAAGEKKGRGIEPPERGSDNE